MFLLIFGVFLFLLLCFCVVMLLSLAKPTKTETKKKHPQKSGSTSGYFLQDKLWLHVPKLLLFFWLFSCFFACCSKNPIKIGFFEDFDMLIFSFFGQKSRVNNLAMVELITWPFFWPKFCPKKWPSY